MSCSDHPVIHQEITNDAAPARVYDAPTDAKKFGEFTGGASAEIDAVAGYAADL